VAAPERHGKGALAGHVFQAINIAFEAAVVCLAKSFSAVAYALEPFRALHTGHDAGDLIFVLPLHAQIPLPQEKFRLPALGRTLLEPSFPAHIRPGRNRSAKGGLKPNWIRRY
jgi:hypothetical protein